MSFDSREFRNAMGSFSTGVTVISVNTEDGVHAMTANSITSVSLDPPILLICIDHKANSLDLIKKVGTFGVNILKEEQIDISRIFAKQKVEEEPEFAFETIDNGAPLLKDSLVNLDCKVVQEVEAGDHTVFFGEVLNLNNNEGNPLCFFRGQYRYLLDTELVK